MLVAEHNLPVTVRDSDGKLEFVRKYDIDVGDRSMFWMGVVAL
jgi:hypothetical protein